MKFSSRIMTAAMLGLLAGCGQSPIAPSAPPSDEFASAPATRSVSVGELREKVQVIGLLRRPLGKVVTIKGQAVRAGERNDYWSVNMAHDLFHVQTVDGKPVSTDIQVNVPRGVAFPPNGTASYTGYEDGGFVNPPAEASNFDPELRDMQSNGRHFETQFYVLKVNP